MSLHWQAPLLQTCCVVGFLPPSSLPPLLLPLPFTLRPLPFFWLPSLSKATNSIFPTSLQHWLIPPRLVLTPCQAIFICHLSLANTVHTYPREILETDDKGIPFNLLLRDTCLHIQVCNCLQTCTVLIHIRLSMHTHQYASTQRHTSKQPHMGTQSTHFAVHKPLSSKSLHTPLWKDLL